MNKICPFYRSGHRRCACKSRKAMAASLRKLASELRKKAKTEPGQPSHPISYFGATTWATAAAAAERKALNVEFDAPEED